VQVPVQVPVQVQVENSVAHRMCEIFRVTRGGFDFSLVRASARLCWKAESIRIQQPRSTFHTPRYASRPPPYQMDLDADNKILQVAAQGGSID